MPLLCLSVLVTLRLICSCTSRIAVPTWLFTALALIVLTPLSSMADLLYKVTFEDGTVAANPGESIREDETRKSLPGKIFVVDNPVRNERNTSAKVGVCRVPQGYVRAELTSQRLPTQERTHVYKWSYLLPNDFFANTNAMYPLLSQWKTYPCEVGGTSGICGPESGMNGGIFNDLSMIGKDWRFRFRAQPDCIDFRTTPVTQGLWVNFVLEILWTKQSNGYFKLWRNDSLLLEKKSIKTLFDSFQPNTCDIRWSVGFYNDWTGSKDSLYVYVDNLEIHDTSGVTGVDQDEQGIRQAYSTLHDRQSTIFRNSMVLTSEGILFSQRTVPGYLYFDLNGRRVLLTHDQHGLPCIRRP